MKHTEAMTEDSVRQILLDAGAKVMSRAGRSDHYGSPRDFSFEVKAAFPNGMGLHIVARQFNYRDPWEVQGRVNDVVDVYLLKDGGYSRLPKGYDYFQGEEIEENVEEATLRELVRIVKGLNPKIYELQKLTGDL
jgi:hypothetical protein